jgi:serine/threonine protein kinase
VADIWSLGIMSYISMTGMVPFKAKGDDLEELNNNILF